MQLSAPPPLLPDPTEVATALRSATDTLGHRPAITVLSARGREEQGVASLAQWAAKGAHLLELDLLLEPGDRLRLDAPLSWTSAAVCLAAWWAGITVTLDGDAEVAVVHESRPRPACDEVFWVGDAIDGAPLHTVDGEPWVRAVQSFPDQPPRPRADAELAALHHAATTVTQRDLLARARQDADGAEASGTLGVDADSVHPVDGLIAVTLRPLIVGRPTVVLQQVDRALADGERVSRWW